jgi:hypothetical protein
MEATVSAERPAALLLESERPRQPRRREAPFGGRMAARVRGARLCARQ